MPHASLLHRSVALGTPVGKKNSQRWPGGPSHAKCEEAGQTGAQRADLRRQAPKYDEYARIPSRRRPRIEHIAWSMSMRCCPARRAVPNVYLRTSAASDPMQVKTCIMSIRMLSIPAADMLKVACLAHRPSSYRSMLTRRRISTVRTEAFPILTFSRSLFKKNAAVHRHGRGGLLRW